MKERIFILTVSSLFCLGASAQKNERISIDADSMRFENLVHEIESKTGCYFYYDKAELDSFKITLPSNFLHQPLKSSDTLSKPQVVLTGNPVVKEKIKSSLENKLFEIGSRT